MHKKVKIFSTLVTAPIQFSRHLTNWYDLYVHHSLYFILDSSGSIDWTHNLWYAISLSRGEIMIGISFFQLICDMLMFARSNIMFNVSGEGILNFQTHWLQCAISKKNSFSFKKKSHQNTCRHFLRNFHLSNYHLICKSNRANWAFVGGQANGNCDSVSISEIDNIWSIFTATIAFTFIENVTHSTHPVDIVLAVWLQFANKSKPIQIMWSINTATLSHDLTAINCFTQNNQWTNGQSRIFYRNYFNSYYRMIGLI